jgi:deazaflavin-dependent oxidoreductase (nitroreductase family)
MSEIAASTVPASIGPLARRLVRVLASLFNPAVKLVAGRRWMPAVGVLQHRGRRTGRTYATPVGMRRLAGGYVLPLTFGDHSAWYRNVLSAGGAVVIYRGETHRVVEPRVVGWSIAAPAFPRYERLQFRLVGIRQFLSLRQAPEEVTA